MKLTIAIIAITAAFATTASAGFLSQRQINEGMSTNMTAGRLAGNTNYSPRLTNENGGSSKGYSFSNPVALNKFDAQSGSFLR